MKATEILALVKERLITQGCPSRVRREDGGLGSCMYNGDGNQHCGIGWLAPGKPFVEGHPITAMHDTPTENTRRLVEFGVISKAQLESEAFRNFLGRVQQAHDYAPDSPDLFVKEVTIALEMLELVAEELDGLS